MSAENPGAANRTFEIFRAKLAAARQRGELGAHVPDACADIAQNRRKPVARYLDLDELERLGAAQIPVWRRSYIRQPTGATPRPDTADLFPVRKRRPRRRFQPGEQRDLPLPVVPPIPHDLRLVALADLAGDPILQGDVLALLGIAWAADRPLVMTEREGAALLARAPRRPPAARAGSSMTCPASGKPPMRCAPW